MGREPALFLDFSAVSCYPFVLKKSQILSSLYKNKILFEELQRFGLQYFAIFLVTEDYLID